MPASYGLDHTATEAMLPWSVVSDWMASARNYWVGTTRPDGRPHAAPVWGVWLDEVLYFATDATSRKGRNLAANPALVVHLESGDEVAIFEGTAEEVTDASLLARFAEAYEAKYRFRPDTGHVPSGVYRLQPRAAFAWREKDFPRSAVRWRFDHD